VLSHICSIVADKLVSVIVIMTAWVTRMSSHPLLRTILPNLATMMVDDGGGGGLLEKRRWTSRINPCPQSACSPHDHEPAEMLQ
jgi:hypothetical protein